jgi:mono/diheme cytochrome c family protein
LIILFETTMLGTMWSSFFGLLGESRLPIFKQQIYDPRITEGLIGLAVSGEENLLANVEEALRANGTHDVVRQDGEAAEDRTHLRFWMGAGVAVLALGAITMLMAYDVIKIPFPTQMAEQESVGYLEGPRKAAPAEAVPIQGPVLVGNQPATTPVPSSADSVQRGKYLFSITCAVCHGSAGDGKSPIAAFFKPPPFDLTGNTVQQLSDQEIYLVITNGFKSMPSQAENLNREERWDVVNYVRTLKK